MSSRLPLLGFFLMCFGILSLIYIVTQSPDWPSFTIGFSFKKDHHPRNMEDGENGDQKLIKSMLEKIEVPQDRLAVISYIPNSVGQVYNFIPMLYGSWKYFTDYRDKLIHPSKLNKTLNIDLLTFCHPLICVNIQHVCKMYMPGNNRSTSTCWYIEQSFEIGIPYGPINSFVMFNRTDISEILAPYKYILRTDVDVFLSPAILTWIPDKKLVTGHGGYCDKFNMDRLKQIALKLRMTHRGVHCVGSTWYGETSLHIKAAKKALEVTAYVFKNEFDPKAPGLESINFTANREGEWIRWWRPVSSLYGAELALNDLISDFSSQYIQELDTPSCSTKSIWQSPHIHCWHDNCEFQKFKFVKYLKNAIDENGNIPGNVVHKIIKSIYFQDVTSMNIKQYTTYIAWSSVGKYLKNRFVKND